MNEQDKLIEEQLKTLPQNLQQAISSVPWKSSLQEIGKQNNLNTEQIDALEKETMFVIYEFENPVDYPANIIRELNISEKIAYAIVESVANKIFDPILAKVPETSPANLPMVEKGEVAHEVPHVEQPTIIPASPKVPVDYSYPEGKDPYREAPK